jgi:hypothetical protein
VPEAPPLSQFEGQFGRLGESSGMGKGLPELSDAAKAAAAAIAGLGNAAKKTRRHVILLRIGLNARKVHSRANGINSIAWGIDVAQSVSSPLNCGTGANDDRCRVR